LLPFSVEKPGFSVGASIIRAWANPFGPLGTPLLDREEPAETLDNMLEALSQARNGLPGVLVLPDIRLDGPVADCSALLQWTQPVSRRNRSGPNGRFFESALDADAYLAKSISRHHRRECGGNGGGCPNMANSATSSPASPTKSAITSRNS
jgi:hypothetical protein